MKHATTQLMIVLVALLSLTPTMRAMADVEIPLSQTQRGQLLLSSNDHQYHSAPTLKTAVNMTITGLVARVKVAQHFTNPSDEWLNGVYTFALPEQSAVDHLTMQVGERQIEGQIKAKQQAKRIFARAKQAGKKASLVEQQRSNVFTNNVANIGPGETVIITIEYQQILHYDQGEFSVRFPLVVAPRYVPPSQPIEGFSGDGWALSQPKQQDSQAANFVTIDITLNSGFELDLLESDFHPVIVNERQPQQFDIRLDQGQTIANRDFVLRWRPLASQMPQGAFFSQQQGDDTYALLMVLPPVAPLAQSQVLSKEMVFVIDTSGSMHGESMRQAKQALLSGLQRLRVGDRFNIVEFNSQTNALFGKARAVNDDTLAQARQFVNGLEAEGGTNIADALNMALPRSIDQSMIRQVVFITDGSVSNEEQLFDIISQNLADSRLFTIGIGSAPNSRFMRGAATFGRGSYTYIGAVEQVNSRISELFAKLENPVLSDINISDGAGYDLSHKVDFWPNPIADLYLGEPIMVSLKLPPDQQNLSVSGKLAMQDWQLDLPISTAGEVKGLDVLWARNKIRSLSESARTAKQRKLNEQAITKLGLKHHLVTRYTSLVAVDVTPSKPQGVQANERRVANHLPDGWTAHQPHGQLPRGATSATANLLVGVLLLILTWLMSRLVPRRTEQV